MGTYNNYFINKLPEKVCPSCGMSHPLDWFGQGYTYEIRSKKNNRVVSAIRYRKYVNCWKCRSLYGLTTLTNPAKFYMDDVAVYELYESQEAQRGDVR